MCRLSAALDMLSKRETARKICSCLRVNFILFSYL
jgi:hypothetical protein